MLARRTPVPREPEFADVGDVVTGRHSQHDRAPLTQAPTDRTVWPPRRQVAVGVHAEGHTNATDLDLHPPPRLRTGASLSYAAREVWPTPAPEERPRSVPGAAVGLDAGDQRRGPRTSLPPAGQPARRQGPCHPAGPPPSAPARHHRADRPHRPRLQSAPGPAPLGGRTLGADCCPADAWSCATTAAPRPSPRWPAWRSPSTALVAPDELMQRFLRHIEGTAHGEESADQPIEGSRAIAFQADPGVRSPSPTRPQCRGPPSSGVRPAPARVRARCSAAMTARVSSEGGPASKCRSDTRRAHHRLAAVLHTPRPAP